MCLGGGRTPPPRRLKHPALPERPGGQSGAGRGGQDGGAVGAGSYGLLLPLIQSQSSPAPGAGQQHPEQVRPEAETRIKSSLVLEQIAKEENIEVSEDEINAEVEKMAAQYGMEADKLKEYLGDAEKESIKRDLSVTKAVDLIMENVKERAKAKTKKEKEAEEATEE